MGCICPIRIEGGPEDRAPRPRHVMVHGSHQSSTVPFKAERRKRVRRGRGVQPRGNGRANGPPSIRGLLLSLPLDPGVPGSPVRRMRWRAKGRDAIARDVSMPTGTRLVSEAQRVRGAVAIRTRTKEATRCLGCSRCFDPVFSIRERRSPSKCHAFTVPGGNRNRRPRPSTVDRRSFLSSKEISAAREDKLRVSHTRAQGLHSLCARRNRPTSRGWKSWGVVIELPLVSSFSFSSRPQSSITDAAARAASATGSSQ